jgi:hypothetical protein
MKYGLALSIFVLFYLNMPAHAEIYKWTDEQGRVHFSDKPAGENTSQYHLRTPASTSSSSNEVTPGDAERRIKQRKLMESLEADRLEKEQAAAKQKQQQAARGRKCQYARAELRASKNANLIYDYDAQGNRVYLSEAQKKKYLESKFAAVQKWCE